jgi:hypothetical protein
MARRRLDQRLLRKLSAKVSKSEQYIREQLSKRASKLGIASEVAQILWAKEYGIGTARFYHSLPPHIQDQVHKSLPAVFSRAPLAPLARVRRGPRRIPMRARRDSVRLASEFLLVDHELRERCGDLLRAKGKFDRVFREATTLLDDRLRILGSVAGKMNPADLVGKALNPDPDKAVLIVSDEADEQAGFFHICKGLVLAFRNPTHHRLTDRFTREDALRFCGFVDILLATLKQARRNPSVL